MIVSMRLQRHRVIRISFSHLARPINTASAIATSSRHTNVLRTRYTITTTRPFCLDPINIVSQWPKPHKTIHRTFKTEASFHTTADTTLNTIQDTLEDAFEASPNAPDGDVNVASGVLTLTVGDKTWVINKQTPNRQIWWSSPVSGPRRYEFDEGRGVWVFTRDTAAAEGDCVGTTLGEVLSGEMKDLFGLEVDLGV
mmetsp:Transcript_30796/g.37588  ORF Transcript_30796/g.37588 Transcript_30796/m.37588 type:complete len:197 (+) Transcript_30796:75-665(+)|eukprot:CAMPEP_0172500508 /NCGR_PEP_ID=MMETSP1066-20121228/139314_1 /TAXON_ID=671091 /ORGANISM="Coscinodiscus wailesii, Strain CCMP2513" /LENGTH=196 /DNA_ID=CAMNT_0013274779 /DNA_START=68 /DNA_END=658 /DNA_ORIENTATION=+